VFLLVPAYPGCPGPKAVKQLCVCVCVLRACLCVSVYGHGVRIIRVNVRASYRDTDVSDDDFRRASIRGKCPSSSQQRQHSGIRTASLRDAAHFRVAGKRNGTLLALLFCSRCE